MEQQCTWNGPTQPHKDLMVLSDVDKDKLSILTVLLESPPW